MIITIDGPAGSGKSTVARMLAAKLGIAYLDTGAMYRAVALAAIEQGVGIDDEQALVGIAERCDIQVECGPTQTRVTLNGADVSDAIRTMAVNQATSFVARVPAIRGLLVKKQQAIGRKLGSLVTEGRDQGSAVFPDADAKFFLDASLEQRAKRRHDELIADGKKASFEEILQNLRLRDGNDERQWTPLLKSPRAIQVDTSALTISEVVDRLYAEVQARCLAK